jgi:hypothetical protein
LITCDQKSRLLAAFLLEQVSACLQYALLNAIVRKDTVSKGIHMNEDDGVDVNEARVRKKSNVLKFPFKQVEKNTLERMTSHSEIENVRVGENDFYYSG